MYAYVYYQVAGWAVTTRGKGSLRCMLSKAKALTLTKSFRSAVLGHNIRFHEESTCLKAAVPEVNSLGSESMVCAETRYKKNLSLLHCLTAARSQASPSVTISHLRRCNRFVKGPVFCPSGPEGQFQVLGTSSFCDLDRPGGQFSNWGGGVVHCGRLDQAVHVHALAGQDHRVP